MRRFRADEKVGVEIDGRLHATGAIDTDGNTRWIRSARVRIHAQCNRHVRIVGERWSPKADPTGATLEDEGIAAFKSAAGDWQPGLGLVSANVVPRLNGDSRWGRLYGLGQVDPTRLAFGVADGTAIVLSPTAGASVAGGTSVVVLDGRQATFSTAVNGAIGATNVVLDVFGPGEQMTSAR